jgi:F-type H+-transporting ATPase subunit b
MDLIVPSEGLLFWTTLVFVILLVLLKKFAWKPILEAIQTREGNIQTALDAAKEAEAKMSSLTAQNEELLKAAREERSIILKEAKEAKEAIISEAKASSQVAADKIMSDAREMIVTEKMKAVTELKNQVAGLSIEIAERILRSELEDKSKQETLINGLIEDVKLN